MIRLNSYIGPLFLGAFLFVNFLTIGQELQLKFLMPTTNTLYFSEVIGSSYYPVDSFKLENSHLRIDTRNRPSGYYKLHFSETNIVDIILNNEEIVEIAFHDTLLQDGVNVIQSKENTILWNYKYYSRNIQALQGQIYIQRSYLNAEDSLYQELSSKLDTLEKLKKAYLFKLANENRNSFFARTSLALSPPLFLEGTTSAQLHFRNVNFNDPTLIRSAVFSSSIMEYFQKYTSYDEQGFQEAVDYILALANQNQEVYEYCLNYMLEVFNLVGPDVIFDYLIETYLLDGGCADANVSNEFKNISESYRKLMPGNQAPLFSIRDTAGVVQQSNKLYVDKPNLLFFWSSQCSHCHEAIPKLVALQNKINVIAISLDNNKQDWIEYITENNLPFTHVSDLLGWDGPTHQLFKVHKTPSYYLVNKNGVIQGKPKSILELENF